MFLLDYILFSVVREKEQKASKYETETEIKYLRNQWKRIRFDCLLI